MRRAFFTAMTLWCLSLAQGLVLPFNGPSGNSTAYALSESLSTVSPVVSGLTLPEPPWPSGWKVIVPSLASPAGVRIAQEITGADWVLTGDAGPNGIQAFLLSSGHLYQARFEYIELVEAWAASHLDRPYHPVLREPSLDQPIGDLLAGHVEQAQIALAHNPVGAKLIEELPLDRALLKHDLGAVQDKLPEPVLAFWRTIRKGQVPTESGIGPIWRAFIASASGDKRTALANGKLLAASNRVVDMAAALLLQRGLNDQDWPQTARKLAASEPRLPLAWEEVSFAAFDEHRPTEALFALQRAVQLDPGNSLYWTNLGWSYYLTGDRVRAISTTERALELKPEVTAEYNLGLFRALGGDIRGALRAYHTALLMDTGNKVTSALRDLADTHQGGLLFFQGYLEARSGRLQESARAFRSFLSKYGNSPLAGQARSELAVLQQAHTKVLISMLSPQLHGKEGRLFGAGEPIYLQVTLSGSPSLSSGKVTVQLLHVGKVVETRAEYVELRPLTVGWRGWIGPLTPPAGGIYTLEVRYENSRTQISLEVGTANLVRLLYAKQVRFLGLNREPLLTRDQLLGTGGTQILVGRVLSALHQAASFASGVGLNQPIQTGPYAGKSIAEWLRSATKTKVIVFLQGVAANPRLLRRQDVVNAFAGWLESRRAPQPNN